MTANILGVLSILTWWLLSSSVGALPCALAAWVVLRWCERGPPVFNRVYLACLLWSLLGTLMLMSLRVPPLAPWHSPTLRLALLIDILAGAALLWRLVPRHDRRRIRLASACMAVAVVVAITFGAPPSLNTLCFFPFN